MYPARLVATVMPQAFEVDWPFQERSSVGPAPATVEALSRFWSRPELVGVAPLLRLPHTDWNAVRACLVRLADPAAPGLQRGGLSFLEPRPPGEDPWTDVARVAEELAREDPIAATIAVLYGAAAWEGSRGEHLFAQLESGPHWGWHVFPLALGRTLLAADAVWTARAVVDLALAVVELAKWFPTDAALAKVAADYTALAGLIDRRLATCSANLAWDLRQSLTVEGSGFRAEVAAMLWTLGRVPHAEHVAGEPNYVPPLSLMHEIVELSMSRLPLDPFLQYLWLELKDRPPFDLRSHKVLFTPINRVYHVTLVHEMEDMGLYSPSGAYARMAIAHFAGGVTAELRREFEDVAEIFRLEVGPREALELLRLESLDALALAPSGPARAGRWAQLAGLATEILAQTVRFAVFDRPPYNTCLDIPFSYLEDAGGGGGVDAALDTLERYRCAGLAYWLAVTPPAPPGEEAGALIDEEEKLLEELRGARFIRLLRQLPEHYRRHATTLDHAEPDVDPFDSKVARRELDETWEGLESVWERCRAVAPHYAAERVEPFASHDEFRRTLVPWPPRDV